MAGNKFATMVHKNTNKITLVLVYAVLEWILIILLLLNSVFSYFIVKFAQFFGLKPPCLWCVRLDRFLEPENNNSHIDLLCELHSKEVSKLGFCSNHGKLVEFHDVCEDCSSGFQKKPKTLSFSKVKKIDLVQSDGEDDVCLKCSCCGVDFERKSFDDASYFVINPTCDFMGFSKNGNSIIDLMGSELESDNFGEKEQILVKETEETEIESIKENLIPLERNEDPNPETPPQDLEFILDYSGNQLVAIESTDSITEDFGNNTAVDEDQEFGDFQKAQVNSESVTEAVTTETEKKTEESVSVLQNVAELLSTIVEKEEFIKFAELDSMEFEETEHSLVFHASPEEKSTISEPNQPPVDTNEVHETEESGDSDHEEAEVSIGTEIPVLDSCDEIKAQDNFNLYSLSHEEPSTSSNDLDFNLEYAQEDEKTVELRNLEQHDPTSITIERKESTAEESFDGSEIDGGGPINTTEKLKSALRAERKALQALYTELEEERSASAVAASETMAMINRLQEEKAAMQMEALQYQRMMEEQSEYDQEALQLLNELMTKKDKELEIFRKKVMDYETKERMRFLASSASCSHSEDGDGTWVDLNHDPKEEQQHSNGDQNTPVETVLNLDFEDERLSILEQLKVLEVKLFTLSDEEDRHFAGVSPIDDYFEENGKYINGNYGYDRRANGSTGKRLLPLFDAIGDESEEETMESNGHENGFHRSKVEDEAVTRFELQKRRIDMEEEVDQLYVRLQALEADREFLKHCIGSLKKGDRGMELLREILQHLRDLRSVDLRSKNSADGTLLRSSDHLHDDDAPR